MTIIAIIGAIFGCLTFAILGVALCVSSSDHITGVNEPRRYTRH